LFFLTLLTGLCFAGDVDYVDLKKGQHAPFGGKLFKKEAIAKIISDNAASLEKCKETSRFNIEKQRLELDLKYKLLDSKYKNDVSMYKDMLAIRDEQLEIEAKRYTFQKWATYGGFILGATTSVAIFYSVSQR